MSGKLSILCMTVGDTEVCMSNIHGGSKMSRARKEGMDHCARGSAPQIGYVYVDEVSKPNHW